MTGEPTPMTYVHGFCRTRIAVLAAMALVLLLPFTKVSALETTTITYKGEATTVTTEIDPKYLGEYESEGGKWLNRYVLNVDGTGVYWAQTLNNPNDPGSGYGWNADGKHTFRWGAMVENGRVLDVEFERMWYGKQRTFFGLLLVVKRDDEEAASTYLYEADGSLYAGYAKKK